MTTSQEDVRLDAVTAAEPTFVDAHALIREFARARRHHLPLTYVRLRLAAPNKRRRRLSSQRSLLDRAADEIRASLRVTDLPHRRGRELHIICPDTDRDGGQLLLERIVRQSNGSLEPGANGVATFPHDGLTLDSLLEEVSAFSLDPASESITRPAWRLRAYRTLKRIAEVMLVLLTLPIAGLIIMLCAAAIRLETPGPAFFRQMRTGRNGRRFIMYKLRTMVLGADSMKRQLSERNAIGGPDFKVFDDPRVTRVGRALRRTSLDELPQLWNILRGDMSIIGPRPTSFGAETYDLWHTRRLDAKPGLTGMWQVEGRNSTSFDERLRLDIYYLEHESLWLDLKIITRTVGAVLDRSGH